MKKNIITAVYIFLLFFTSFSTETKSPDNDNNYLAYFVNPQKLETALYWKDEKGQPIKNFATLEQYLLRKKKKLLFAMNGGMYKEDNSPLGLYIENGRTLSKINKANGEGNFYLKPNGIFYIDNNSKAFIVSTDAFVHGKTIKYATQSGPMLISNGAIHPAFKKGSANVNLRNGVGILPDNRVLFVLSKKEVSLYDFAEYFKNKGCKQALYLDGFVSRAYLPEKNWIQTDGNFGVMIGVTD
jgi:uncharacterized protein YigE (DUF2233 family)